MTTPERPEWDDRDDERADREMSLVMPFLAVISNGGRYEDLSFTAGFQAGLADGRHGSRHILASTCLVYSDLVPQMDLIAMRHGYRCDVLHDDETWAQVGFTRIEEEYEDIPADQGMVALEVGVLPSVQLKSSWDRLLRVLRKSVLRPSDPPS